MADSGNTHHGALHGGDLRRRAGLRRATALPVVRRLSSGAQAPIPDNREPARKVRVGANATGG